MCNFVLLGKCTLIFDNSLYEIIKHFIHVVIINVDKKEVKEWETYNINYNIILDIEESLHFYFSMIVK